MKPKIQKESSSLCQLSSPIDHTQSRNSNQLLNPDKQVDGRHTSQSAVSDLKDNKSHKITGEQKTPSIKIDLVLASKKIDGALNLKLSNRRIKENIQSPSFSNLRQREKTPKLSLSRIPSELPKDQPSLCLKRHKKIDPRVHHRILSVGSSPKHFCNTPEGVYAPIYPSKQNISLSKDIDRQTPDTRILSSSLPFNVNETTTTIFKDHETESSISCTKNYYKKKIANKVLQKNISTSLAYSTKNSVPQRLNKESFLGSPKPFNKQSEGCLQINSARSPLKEESFISQPLASSRLVSPEIKNKESKAPSFRKSLLSSKNTIKPYDTQNFPLKRRERVSPYGLDSKRMHINKQPKIQDGPKTSREADDRDIRHLHLDRLEPQISQLNSSKHQSLSIHSQFSSLKPTYFQLIEEVKLDEFIKNVRNKGNIKQIESQQKFNNCELESENMPKTLNLKKPPLDTLNSCEPFTCHDVLNERNSNIPQGIKQGRDPERKEKMSKSGLPPKGQEKEDKEQKNPILPTKNQSECSLSTKKSENRPCNSIKERSEIIKLHDLSRHTKSGFSESQKLIPNSKQIGNFISSPKMRPDENLSTTDSLSTSKVPRKSPMGRSIGEKISPKGKQINPEKDYQTYSRLDELLKTFKDEKNEQNSDNMSKGLNNSIEKGLFTISFGDHGEIPLINQSSAKGLGRILMSRNENIC